MWFQPLGLGEEAGPRLSSPAREGAGAELRVASPTAQARSMGVFPDVAAK